MSIRLLVVLVASVVSFGVAAKAHGRQLRLERELAGYPHVVFGGTNPPFVEALWRQDRMRYWSQVAGLALLTVGLFAVARSRGWSWPFLGGGGGAVAWLVVWGAPVVAFFTCGVWSLARFLSAAPGRAGTVEAEWVRSALVGSVGWFAAALVAAGGVVIIGTRRVS